MSGILRNLSVETREFSEKKMEMAGVNSRSNCGETSAETLEIQWQVGAYSATTHLDFGE